MDPIIITVGIIIAVALLGAFVFTITMKWDVVWSPRSTAARGRKGRVPLKVPPVSREQFLKVFHTKKRAESQSVTIEKEAVVLEDEGDEEDIITGSGDQKKAGKSQETPSSELEGQSVYFPDKKSPSSVDSTPKIIAASTERVQKTPEIEAKVDGDNKKYLLRVNKPDLYVTLTEEDMINDQAGDASSSLGSQQQELSELSSSAAVSVISDSDVTCESGNDGSTARSSSVGSTSATIKSALSQLSLYSGASGDEYSSMPSKAESLASLHYDVDEGVSEATEANDAKDGQTEVSEPVEHLGDDVNDEEALEVEKSDEENYALRPKPSKTNLVVDYQPKNTQPVAAATLPVATAESAGDAKRDAPWRRGDGLAPRDAAGGMPSQWSYDQGSDRWTRGNASGSSSCYPANRGRYRYYSHQGDGMYGKKPYDYGGRGGHPARFHGRSRGHSAFVPRAPYGGRRRASSGGAWRSFRGGAGAPW